MSNLISLAFFRQKIPDGFFDPMLSDIKNLLPTETLKGVRRSTHPLCFALEHSTGDPLKYRSIADKALLEIQFSAGTVKPYGQQISEEKFLTFGTRFADHKLNTKVAGLYLLRGLALFLAGDFELALEVLQKVGQYLPEKNGSAQFLIGLTYALLNESDEARYFLNLSLSGFGRSLIGILAYRFANQRFDQICAYVEEKRHSALLKRDPLVLYFYLSALCQQSLKAEGELQLEYYLRRYEQFLEAPLEAYFATPGKYLFLQPFIELKFQEFQAKKAKWEDFLGMQALLRKRTMAAEALFKSLAAVETLGGMAVLPPNPELKRLLLGQARSLRRSQVWSFPLLKDAETGGSPHVDEEDEEVESPGLKVPIAAVEAAEVPGSFVLSH